MSAAARREIVWQHLPESWGALVAIAAIAAAIYGVFALYRRELASCPPWARIVLAGLRSVVLLLLAGIWLSPAAIHWQQRTLLPTIVIARDASLSMSTADRYRDAATAQAVAELFGKSPGDDAARQATRAEIASALLEGNRSALVTKLAAKGNVEVLDFGGTVKRAALAARLPGPIPPLTPNQPATDIAAAIREALTAERPAAVVLLTDGQQTAASDPLAAARLAKARSVPLLVVGIGDPARPGSIRVTNVYARPQAWQNEPFEVHAKLSFHGAEMRELRAQLIEQRLDDAGQPSGEPSVVQNLPVQPPAGGSGPARVPFTHTAREAGRFAYRVRIEPPAGSDPAALEVETAASEPPAAVVNILSRAAIRTLLIAGVPTWDYRLVQKLLARDKTIELSCWLQTLDPERGQEGSRPITRLPASREELFEYDVVLLFDPNPDDLNAAWIELLKRFVGEHAGGLLVMAGPQHTSRLLADSQTSGLADLLPVAFGDLAALDLASLLAEHERPWPLAVVPAAADHPVIRLVPDRDQSLRRWESLPGVLWSFPCLGPKPAAQVLIEHPDLALSTPDGPRPLVASGRHGLGRTLYLGLNATWRWRKSGDEAEWFDKFWVSAVRYLVESRALEGDRRGFVETDRDRYELGERVVVRARLHDVSREPLVAPQVTATIEASGDAAQPLSLAAVAGQPGVFEGTVIARRIGSQQVRLTLPGDEPTVVESSFLVELPSRETEEVWLNRPLLVELAGASGGRYFDLSEAGTLPGFVPDRTDVIESRTEPEPLWDTPAMLAALVGLLTAEWLLRKRCKLL